MMYDTLRPAFVCVRFKTSSDRNGYSRLEKRGALFLMAARRALMTVVARPGHSFDNALASRASEKDRRETKETGKERGIGLTRFTALD